MKKIWDTYFYWNRTERRGIIPIFILLAVLIAVNIILRNRTTDEVLDPDSEFMANVEKFEQIKSERSVVDSSTHRRYTYTKSPFQKRERRYKRPSAPFNPNDLSQAQWVELGLSEKQAASISRFKEKGGWFYKKEDLQKMYVISDDFFENIEPYLIFEKPEKSAWPKNNPEKDPVTPSKIDINKADSAQLVSLKGITPKMAQKILAVRKNFGGFHSLEQVKDLYGFHETNYTKLSEDAFAGPVTIEPLNLNYCTFKELMQVPGLDYDKVKKILNHREYKGSFKKTEDLLTLNLAEPDLYAKIAPYLTVK